MITNRALTGAKKRKTKPYKFGDILEEICERRGYNPAEALITAHERLERLIEREPDKVMEALRLQTDVGKAILQKLYPNKSESKITGDQAAPLGLTVTFVTPAKAYDDDES